MAAKKKVLVAFIQDRSGSMQITWAETLNGYKAFVDELKKNTDDECFFTLTTFDTLVDQPLMEVPIDKVTGLELKDHGPRNATALYDAVGQTIELTDDKKYEKIICVVVTDGQENSSREWKKDTLNTQIEERINRGNWTFTYLGTQPETWDDAGRVGVGLANTATYAGAQAGATYAVMGQTVNCLRSSEQRQSKNLFAGHANIQAAASAGMKIKPDPSDKTTTTTTAPPPKRKKLGNGKRWR